MSVTISGNLSSTPNSTNVVNNSGVFISVQDDLQSSSGTNIDCSLDCKSAIFNNTTFGESDSFGVTKRVIINVFGNLDGWNSFLPGYPGRTLVALVLISTTPPMVLCLGVGMAAFLVNLSTPQI